MHRFTITKTCRAAIVLTVTMLCMTGMTVAGDWLTHPSTYTHDPVTGQRTDQYAARQPAVSRVDPSYRESGYRQYRSTLQYGQAADNYHSVERWGEPVRPYGEWRFPVRPYSAPYEAWGAPLAGMNLGGFFPGWPQGYAPPPGYNPGGYHPGGATSGHPGHGNGHPGHGNGHPGHGNGHPGYGNGHPGYGNGHPGYGNGHPGFGNGYHPGQGGFAPQGFGHPGFSNGGASLTPYPAFPQGGYPVPPYYDGAYPTYGETPRLNDRQFYYKPQQ